MSKRGWGWTVSQIRQIQLLEWIAAQSVGNPAIYVDLHTFYQPLDLGAAEWGSALADVNFLDEQRGLINQASGMGGIEDLAAMLSAAGRGFLEGLEASRGDKRRRRSECRDAMVAWLYSEDAINTAVMRNRAAMLDNPTYGMWLAQPFLESDLSEAATWLRGCGLVDGVMIAEDPGPIIVRLTEPGVTCAEQFDSETSRYVESRSGKPVGQSITFGNVTGPVQVARDHAHQVQHVGADAAEIRLLIAGIVEVVRATAPGEVGIEAQQAEALAAINNGRADKNALERFGRWAVSTAEGGATSGVVAVISSAVTTLLTHLAHLG